MLCVWAAWMWTCVAPPTILLATTHCCGARDPCPIAPLPAANLHSQHGSPGSLDCSARPTTEMASAAAMTARSASAGHAMTHTNITTVLPSLPLATVRPSGSVHISLLSLPVCNRRPCHVPAHLFVRPWLSPAQPFSVCNACTRTLKAPCSADELRHGCSVWE